MNAELVTNLMRTNHQLGVVNRFARKCLRDQSIPELQRSIQDALVEFSLDIVIVLFDETTPIAIHYGNEGTMLLRQLVERQEAIPDTNVAVHKDTILISYINVLLSCRLSDPDQISTYQDSLAIFAETINEGVEKILLINALKTRHKNQSDKIANNLLSWNNKLSRMSIRFNSSQREFSSQLILNFTYLFPTIGLDADQEENIMEIIENFNDQQTVLTEQQSNLLMKLQQSLQGAISFIGQPSSISV